VRWLVSTLLVQLLKSVSDRNRTTPCWYHDFDCVRLWPKYSFFDCDSIIVSSLAETTDYQKNRSHVLLKYRSNSSVRNVWYPYSCL